MAYMISSNMDSGYKDFQIEAAIGKIYASVSIGLHMFYLFFQVWSPDPDLSTLLLKHIQFYVWTTLRIILTYLVTASSIA